MILGGNAVTPSDCAQAAVLSTRVGEDTGTPPLRFVLLILCIMYLSVDNTCPHSPLPAPVPRQQLLDEREGVWGCGGMGGRGNSRRSTEGQCVFLCVCVSVSERMSQRYVYAVIGQEVYCFGAGLSGAWPCGLQVVSA